MQIVGISVFCHVLTHNHYIDLQGVSKYAREIFEIFMMSGKMVLNHFYVICFFFWYFRFDFYAVKNLKKKFEYVWEFCEFSNMYIVHTHEYWP